MHHDSFSRASEWHRPDGHRVQSGLCSTLCRLECPLDRHKTLYIILRVGPAGA